MILATLHTPNYTFQALGTDEAHALKLMRTAWREHKRQTGAWDQWSDVVEDVYLCPLEPGMVLRDGSPIVDTRTE